MLEETDPTKRQRKKHHKSRGGCVTCKRRKVKCDEAKPVCVKCVRFRVPCGYARPGEPVVLMDHRFAVEPEAQSLSEPPRRKPGRPRKIWTPVDVSAAKRDTIGRWLRSQDAPTVTVPSPDSVPRPDPDTNSDPDQITLDTDTAELLLHWTRHTAPSVAAFTDPADADLAAFWSHEAPSIGLVPSSSFVLHLVLALSARHLLFLETSPIPQDSLRRRRLRALAARHTARGVAGMAVALAALDVSACGSLYVASLLICFCSLAAGPTGPDDLLVASASLLRPHTCMPLISGVRLIREAFPPSVLFAGALAALDRGEGRHDDDDDDDDDDAVPWRAPWKTLGARRLCWEGPLERLKDLVNCHADSEETGRVRAVSELSAIYEAFYGREGPEGTDAAPGVPASAYRHVLRWLYVISESFVASLQQGDDVSLLLLAHFAPLLQNHRNVWFLRGWSEQLVLAARAKLSPWYVSWMQWPLEATGLLGETDGGSEELEGGEGEGEGKGDGRGNDVSVVCMTDILAVYPSP